MRLTITKSLVNRKFSVRYKLELDDKEKVQIGQYKLELSAQAQEVYQKSCSAEGASFEYANMEEAIGFERGVLDSFRKLESNSNRALEFADEKPVPYDFELANAKVPRSEPQSHIEKTADTDWERKEFPPIPDNLPIREKARRETNQDLSKPIQQLMCDVHEETMQIREGRQLDNIMHATKRMVSLMGRVALENQRTSAHIKNLTCVLVVLTFILAIPVVVEVLKWVAAR